MKSSTHYLWFNTQHHREYINITPDVAAVVKDSGVEEGFCLVSAMNMTAGVYVNDSDPNGDAHLKRMLVGHQVTFCPLPMASLIWGRGNRSTTPSLTDRGKSAWL